MLEIIDYGSGNLQSVSKALAFLGCESHITDDPEVLTNADMAILPGVGAFGDAMSALKSRHLDSAIIDYAKSGKPLLGICLGLQLLFEESEESPGVKGLGILKGSINKIPSGDLKVPHIGWNSLDIKKSGGLFTGVPQESYVYFVHSYFLTATDSSIVSAATQYGVKIDAAVQSGNVFATQFHPEKSGKVGLKMLQNFVGGAE